MKRFAGIIILIAIVSIPIALALSRSDGARGGPSSSVAVIELSGGIRDAAGDSVGVSRGSRPVLEHLAKAREDGRVAAVALRINSGGGSAAFSQEIHRAIQKIEEAGKPVVVSMGDAAASGAYYVATAADRILANPATITGSIGVYIQYLNVAELAKEYGVEYVTVKTGPFKDVGNPTEPFTDDQRAMLQLVVDNTLEQFVSAVAEGRSLDIESVRQVADGRIFTGQQAKELGLIDDFGGLEDAIRLAAELAGIEGEPRIVVYRKPDPWYARYLNLMFGDRVFRSLGDELLPSLLDSPSQPRLMF